MKTIFEQQGVEYRQAGDYMLPNVGMGEQKEYQIGVWGQRYKRHLKSNHRVIYYNYLTSGRLYEHLAEVDTRAEVMFHELVKTLAEKENVTEKLKAENTLLWIRKMNNIRGRRKYFHVDFIKTADHSEPGPHADAGYGVQRGRGNYGLQRCVRRAADSDQVAQ